MLLALHQVEPAKEDKEAENEDAKTKPAKNRLDMVRWVASFDSRALAAHAAGIWPFSASLAHKRPKDKQRSRSSSPVSPGKALEVAV